MVRAVGGHSEVQLISMVRRGRNIIRDRFVGVSLFGLSVFALWWAAVSGTSQAEVGQYPRRVEEENSGEEVAGQGPERNQREVP